MKLLSSVFAIGAIFSSMTLTSLGQSRDLPPNQDIAFLKKAALKVDRHVADVFKKKKLAVPKVADDPTFLRRVFLVAAGRIPSLEEARTFLEIEDPEKREFIVNYLLKSDGYRSHMTNWVFDLLRVNENFEEGRRGTAAPYIQFITEEVKNDLRWNAFAKKLVSAQGSGWSEGNGAVGYYVRDKGMPLDNLANTMRLFTGERMECAQCHDSPSNRWEQRDFFELAAFTSGQEEINYNVWDEIYREIRETNQQQSEFGKMVEWLGYNVHYFSLAGGGKGRVELPLDYQYSDGEPGEMIGGRTHFGKTIRSSAKDDAGDSREEFAEWLTAQSNDHFTFVIVNRMWERIMGSPLSAPVDEFKEISKTISPPLMRELCQLMIQLEYDLRAFQQVLLLTKTFQFEASGKVHDAGVAQALNGRQLQRMSAEQIWDSLVTLVAEKPDELAKRSFVDTIFYQDVPVLVGEKTMAELSDEVLEIANVSEYRQYVNGLLEAIKKGGSSASAKPMKPTSMMMMTQGTRPGAAVGLARASELPSPAPAGHFLRDFGQSDRLLIDSATREPNMAQVLSVMNGHVEKMVVSNTGAAVYKALEASKNADKVRYLYYAILSRPPSESEMKMLMSDVIDGSPKSFQNLVSALISTHEFIFIQ